MDEPRNQRTKADDQQSNEAKSDEQSRRIGGGDESGPGQLEHTPENAGDEITPVCSEHQPLHGKGTARPVRAHDVVPAQEVIGRVDRAARIFIVDPPSRDIVRLPLTVADFDAIVTECLFRRLALIDMVIPGGTFRIEARNIVDVALPDAMRPFRWDVCVVGIRHSSPLCGSQLPQKGRLANVGLSCSGNR